MEGEDYVNVIIGLAYLFSVDINITSLIFTVFFRPFKMACKFYMLEIKA